MVPLVLVSPQVFAAPDHLGEAAAALILDRLAARGPGRPFLLGCPGGRSARSTYRQLALQAASDRTDLSGLVVVMMDEYLVPGRSGRLEAVGADQPHSCRRFGAEEIVGQLNRALREARVGQERMVPAENLWLPDVADAAAYDQRIADAGGIDLFLLASGAGDGHVAFNSPGTDRETRTRVVPLPESTRRDNLATFPSFGADLRAVPEHGLTVGIATIRELSAEVVMVLHGPDKQLAARRLMAADHYQPDWPATVLAECRSPRLFVDVAAHPTGALASAPR